MERSMAASFILHFLERERSDSSSAHSDIFSFFGFCHRNMGNTHSQILQDLWVLYSLDEIRKGYFVEFGACDGKLLSNTLLLEESYGWKGILAEPNREWHAALAEARSAKIVHKCVAPRTGETVPFMATDQRPELSRMADIIPSDIHERNGNRSQHSLYDVETISLLDLLRQNDAPEVIDYLSIDTEGSEFEILSTFDFDAYQFRLITVEHAGESEKRERIRELLERHGYHRWLPELTRWDDWYVGPSLSADESSVSGK
ncbi:MAG: FkbM family methyltransferase [Pseudomonadota bacterium]